MSIEVKVPNLPESVADALVAKWYKKPGDRIQRDENLVDLETDKVVLEVLAPRDGVLQQILKETGATVVAEEILAVVEPSAATIEASAPAAAPANATKQAQSTSSTDAVGPAARRLLQENDVQQQQIQGTGKGGRITRQDVVDYLGKISTQSKDEPSGVLPLATGERPERRVPMSRLRARIAERLLAAQHNAAMLTTFNEINLKALMELRQKYRDPFEKKYGVRLGFMSFFTKAAVEALKRFPAVNASIDGSDIVYHGYYDVGIAVSTERGLVVPILRDADTLSMATIEKNIGEFADRARNNQLSLEEITGGTFTITNGGVFGSLLATPIINPPQTAILGMHKIEERPIAENGQVVVRPMMYVALSYDHRLIDGKESVQFLVTIKEILEDPTRLLLDI